MAGMPISRGVVVGLLRPVVLPPLFKEGFAAEPLLRLA